jgi:hypothetical protein
MSEEPLIIITDSSQSQAVRKPSGHILLDNQVVADTLQCAHCQKHWVPVKGSGVRRGFCMKCMAPTCGAAACDICAPFEKKMEEYERGKRAVLR